MNSPTALETARPETAPAPVVPGLVTIVVPAYQADPYIADALQGIRRQRYASWELIVVEDGSHGNTRSQVEAFAREKADHRIVYLEHEKNRGLGATRNTGMEHARGEFLALLDADDVWLETHLAAAVEAIERQRADIAYSTVVKFENGTNQLLGIWGPTREEVAAFPASLPRRNFITPSATVMRRRVIDAVGWFDTNPDIHMCEDLDYWLRSVEAGQIFAHVPGCHCLYRKGAPGAGSGNLRQIVERQSLVLAKHFGKGGIPPKIWRKYVVYYRTAAGVLNLEEDARRAGRFFFAAWRAHALRLDLLALSLLCRTILPFLPNLGIVRRINRMIHPR